MSKFLKTILTSCYAILLLQYLRISLSPIMEEVDLEYIIRTPKYIAEKQLQYKQLRKNYSAYIKSYKRLKRFPTDYKYILKYTASFLHYGSSMYKNGQSAFIENNCTYMNCYLTNRRTLLNDIRDYDAILFDVENTWETPVLIREPYQKYIFVATESAANFPLCDGYYDEYFNLTWSYRLDSDILWTYFRIYDKDGNFVGPRINMKWIDTKEAIPEKIALKISRKKKAAAWFVSHCNVKSGRMEVAREIEKELKKYDMTLDIYGWCGKLSCPRERLDECLELLESDYFFYFAFENSMSEDYVTEKLLYPLQYYAVPVVYGGANYSRFLPPDSYIDAKELNATEVAIQMVNSMKNTMIYMEYFRWRTSYFYKKTAQFPDICKLCEIMNLEADKETVHKGFRYWWNPNYDSLCRHSVGRHYVKKPNKNINDNVLDVIELKEKDKRLEKK